MSRQRIKTTWKIPSEDGLLRKYARYLRDKGIRSSTLDSYVFRVGRYLNYCDQKQPSQETPQNFRDQIMDDGLSRSSVNNYCFAIRKFHQMLGLDFEFAFLKPHSTPASIMVQNGCDLLTIQQVMRYNDIQTTMRYLHLADKYKRESYDRFLKL